jgi:hypothetical protein
MPARPLPSATRKHPTAPSITKSTALTSLAARIPSGAATADISARRVDGLTRATESSTLKIQPPMPNKSDTKTGWGPIENLTVATLDFVRQSTGPMPKEAEAFTDLARWLANTTGAASTSQLSGADGASVTQEEMQHFARVAHKLLGLNRNAMSALMESPPTMDTAHHSAKALWRSLPQPANMPVVRISPRLCRGHCLRPLTAVRPSLEITSVLLLELLVLLLPTLHALQMHGCGCLNPPSSNLIRA